MWVRTLHGSTGITEGCRLQPTDRTTDPQVVPGSSTIHPQVANSWPYVQADGPRPLIPDGSGPGSSPVRSGAHGPTPSAILTGSPPREAKASSVPARLTWRRRVYGGDLLPSSSPFSSAARRGRYCRWRRASCVRSQTAIGCREGSSAGRRTNRDASLASPPGVTLGPT
jgi:hypothetical protein